MKIRVNEIRVDTRVSIRERNDEETIQRYEATLESLPSIIVFRTNDKYLLADGFHRLAAAERLGWEYINAEVREGTYQDAVEFAVKANLKHGKPLTPAEYEMALMRLKYLHEDWTQEKLASALDRSREWVSSVIAADRVEKMLPGTNLDTRTKAEISRAPKELWRDIGRTAEEQEWTRDETQEKVKTIKAEPYRAHEILHPSPPTLVEAPADKLIPLTREINKLCEMQDQFCKRLDPSVYDWGSGALATHTLQGLYVLAEKTTEVGEKTIQLGEKTRKLAEETKRMIEFLERRRGEEKERKRERDSMEKEVSNSFV